MRILVVDDDSISVEIIAGTLLETGYDVETRFDAASALELACSGEIDLVISDWIMPGMDGVELCQRIRREAPRYVYFVLVTARDAVDDVVEGLQAGADDFIPKPFDPFELEARVRTIRRMKRLHDQIEAQNHQMARTQRLKDDWTRMIVHDLRSPLMAILGYTELAAAKAPAVARELGIASEEAQRLSEMLEQMLIMAKSEDGRLRPHLTRCDAAPIASAAVRALEGVARERGVRIELEVPESLPLDADKSLLRRLIDNLTSNAVKFSPAVGTVRVVVAEHDGELRIEVSDEGPGVPPEAEHRLFEKYEVAELRALGVPQHGLGLAFCRLVTSAHGGSISYRPGVPSGSRFEACLPIVQSSTRRSPAVTVEPDAVLLG